MLTRSRAGGRADEDESLALRGIFSVRAVLFRGSGSGQQTHRPRAPELRPLRIRLLHRRAVRHWLADVFRPRLARTARLRHRLNPAGGLVWSVPLGRAAPVIDP